MARIPFPTLAPALLTGAAVLTFAGAAMAEPEFNLRGRVHLDYAVHDEDQVDLDDGFLFPAPASA